MKHNFFIRTLTYLLIYLPISVIIEVTTEGDLSNFLTYQRLFSTLFFGVFMAALMPHVIKKHK
ncbi:hypothetical protein [Streptococcus ovuberis]|uniref:Uncharacterized protein n=1 Tax=Streptococcus ovuberis TaxID=1936207 RepID=A0A7X6MYR2_9STRE|nr:hypothetical protein [Streptococcus ovuberis]NKZ20850.1 hypothetical protein [Streptococcus ovuberis]